MAVTRIAVALTVRDLNLTAFYRDAFGFSYSPARRDEDLPRLLGCDVTADVSTVTLGDDTVELAAFAPPGRAYPADLAANDVRFQHFAIVVSDMRAAYARLQSVAGWTTISRGGPQRLPASSGGVIAFKFRDPEGHPLELLEFTADVPERWRNRRGLCLGIDHSAIAVTETRRALALYRDGLGLSVAGRSLNRGTEQDFLDGLAGARVEVTSLRATAGLGIELLAYARPASPAPVAPTDLAATRLVLTVDDPAAAAAAVHAHGGTPLSDIRAGSAARDPDGHILVFTTAR